MENEKILTKINEDIKSEEIVESEKNMVYDDINKEVLMPEEMEEENSQGKENEAKEEENFFSKKQELVDEIAKEIVNKFTSGKASTLEELKEYFATEFSKNDKISENNGNFLQICDNDIEKIQNDFPSLDKEFIINEINGNDFKRFATFNKETDITKAYKNYVDYKMQIDSIATEKAKIMYAKRFSSPGSMHSSNLTKILTWENMNDEDFERAISDAKKGYYSKK